MAHRNRVPPSVVAVAGPAGVVHSPRATGSAARPMWPDRAAVGRCRRRRRSGADRRVRFRYIQAMN
jgi:hypothetical protein